MILTVIYGEPDGLMIGHDEVTNKFWVSVPEEGFEEVGPFATKAMAWAWIDLEYFSDKTPDQWDVDGWIEGTRQ